MDKNFSPSHSPSQITYVEAEAVGFSGLRFHFHRNRTASFASASSFRFHIPGLKNVCLKTFCLKTQRKQWTMACYIWTDEAIGKGGLHGAHKAVGYRKFNFTTQWGSSHKFRSMLIERLAAIVLNSTTFSELYTGSLQLRSAPRNGSLFISPYIKIY